MAKLHEGNRVTKLWKDQRWHNNMELAGIATNIAEMNFRLKLDWEDMNKTYDRLINAVKTRIAKSVEKYDSIEELMEFTNKLTGYRKIVEVSELDRNPMNTEDAYLIKLLFACKKERPTKEESEKRNPLRIKIIDRKGKEDEGVAFLHQKINKQFHDSIRMLTNTRKPSRLFDLNTLIAEIIVENALIEFSKSNMDNIKFAYVQGLVKSSVEVDKDNTIFYVPKDEDFRKEFLSYLHDNHLYPKGIDEEKECSSFDAKSKYFYLEEQDNIEYLVTASRFKNIASYEFLNQMYRAKDKTKKEIQQAKNFESARAFETKKNIPKTHLEKMKNNAFKARYEYVEIDELIDIEEEFMQLEEEFKKLQKLTFIPYSKGSFRVRRLGRHKAAGMFVSHVNSTIIDDSSSYIHELHHQIDYTCSDNGLLSESIGFRPVLESYKRAVNNTVESLQDSDTFKAQWNGGTKYNKDYFLDPAEVFARAGEIYLSEVKGIETSFLKVTYKGKPEYPLSEEFLEVVKEYFDRLYNSFYTEGRKEEKKKESVASPKPPSEITEPLAIGNVGKGEQLTLF